MTPSYFVLNLSRARLRPASSLFCIGRKQKLVGVLFGRVMNHQDFFGAKKSSSFCAVCTVFGRMEAALDGQSVFFQFSGFFNFWCFSSFNGLKILLTARFFNALTSNLACVVFLPSWCLLLISELGRTPKDHALSSSYFWEGVGRSMWNGSDLESQSKQILEEGVLKIKVVQNVQAYKISLHMQPLYLLRNWPR